MAARKGLGVLGFSLQEPAQVEAVLTSYKDALREAVPVGAYVNDNIMVTCPAFCAETSAEARQIAQQSSLNYLVSLLYRYHDTFSRPPGFPAWPDVLPQLNSDTVEYLIAKDRLICGDPDEVLRQCKRWESVGVDQLVFNMAGISSAQALTSLELIGEYVIPQIDTDPIHRTSHWRWQAQRRAS